MIPAVCMNPCTVRAHTTRGHVELDAWDVGVPGLVIAVRVGSPFEGHCRYSITHRTTGYTLGAGVSEFEQIEDAVSALMFLADLPSDWTHPDPQENPAQFKADTAALRDHLKTTRPI